MRKISGIFLFLTAVILAVACCMTQPGSPDRRVLLIVSGDNFDDMQYTIATARLRASGFAVDVANASGEKSHSDRGTEITPDLKLSDAVENGYCSLFLTGGASTKSLFGNRSLSNLCIAFNQADKIIAAVQLAPVILAEASLLKGIKATSWPSESKTLEASGALYEKGAITCEAGNIITGMGGSDENCTAFTVNYINALGHRQSVSGSVFPMQNKEIVFQLDKFRTRFVMTHAGKTRTGVIFVPSTHDGKKPYSLVLGLHGKQETGRQFQSRSGFDCIARELDFIMVYPDNYTGDWDILPATETINDDLGYIGSLIDALKKIYTIDPARVYATGHSDGAFMAYRVAYDLSDRITAVAPVAGLVYTPIENDRPPRPVSVLHLQAVDDKSVPFYSDNLYENPLSAMDGVAFWKKLDKITGDGKIFFDRYGIKGTIWSNPENTVDTAILVYPSGGHSWLPFATEQIADFFYNHPARANSIKIDYRSISVYNQTGSTLAIESIVTDPDRVKNVSLYINGEKIGTASRAPFSFGWNPPGAGVYRLTMVAETDKGGIAHSTCNETIRVTLPDIARGADAYASSTENAEVKPENVTDGDFFSRWSSVWSDPQWIEIDLRRLTRVSGVTLVWETAYASDYDIRTSADRKNWQTVFSTAAGGGGTEFISFKPVDARYIRMSGNKRATTWGYSLWDFMVHGNN